MNSRVYGLSFPKKVSLCTYWTEEEWFYVVVVESLSCIWLFATPWTAVHHASLSFTSPEVCWNSCYWVGDAIQTSHPLWPLLLLPSIFPNIRVFPSESDLCIRWPTYWSFSFSITPSNEYSGLISFRTEWFDLLTVQGTFKSLLQHHNSKASIIWCSVFFMVQLSHAYVTNGKIIVLIIQTFVGKVMSLPF